MSYCSDTLKLIFLDPVEGFGARDILTGYSSNVDLEKPTAWTREQGGRELFGIQPEENEKISWWMEEGEGGVTSLLSAARRSKLSCS